MPTVEFNQLAEVVSAHDIQLPDPQLQQLARYCELLWDWNERINLTRHTTLEKFASISLEITEPVHHNSKAKCNACNLKSSCEFRL